MATKLPFRLILSVATITAIVAGCGDKTEPVLGATANVPSAQTQTPVQTQTPTPGPDGATSDAPVLIQTSEASPHVEKPDIRDGNIDSNLFKTDSNDREAYYRFVSPTKSLACGINLHFWGYDVGCQSPDAPKPKDPPPGDPCLSPGVTVSAYSAIQACLGDRFYGGEPGTRVLEYGQIIRVGDIACKSEVTGMTCLYGEHGFTLAREKVVLY